MFAAFRLFWTDDSGATTVDWVVLTAAAIGLTLAMMLTMNGSISTVAGEMETVLGNVGVVELDDLGRGESLATPDAIAQGS
jgi:Flp pilus assembly pilin Flp